MELRYRVFEPGTPRDLPLELVQEWSSGILLTVGAEVRRDDGENWVVAAIAPDPDPDCAGRVFFERVEAS